MRRVSEDYGRHGGRERRFAGGVEKLLAANERKSDYEIKQ
jgi:hypothetical protein